MLNMLHEMLEWLLVILIVTTAFVLLPFTGNVISLILLYTFTVFVGGR